MEAAMDTPALCNLLESFEERKRHDEAAAMLATNACRRVRFMLRTRMITPIIADVRGEIYARETREQRTPDEARWFEQYLEHELAACVAQRDADQPTRTGCPSEGGDAAIGGWPLPGRSP